MSGHAFSENTEAFLADFPEDIDRLREFAKSSLDISFCVWLGDVLFKLSSVQILHFQETKNDKSTNGTIYCEQWKYKSKLDI